MRFKLFHPPNQLNPQSYQVELPARIQNKSSNSGPKSTYHRNLFIIYSKYLRSKVLHTGMGLQPIEFASHSSCNPRNTRKSKLHHVTLPEGAFAELLHFKVVNLCHPSCRCISICFSSCSRVPSCCSFLLLFAQHAR
jgi:hypothetical protein